MGTNPRKHHQWGFTLIELLIVLGVISLLATLVLANLSSARSRARDAERKNDLRQLQNVFTLRTIDYPNFPIAPADGVAIKSLADQGVFRAPDGRAYLGRIPQDGKFVGTTKDYCYISDTTGRYYVVWAQLENANDQDRYRPGVRAPTHPNLDRTCGAITDPKYFLQSE